MAESIGVKLKAEGEKEFKKALADINQQFKVLGSEMQLVSSQFDKNDKSVGAVTARNEVLNKQIDTQKDKISTLEKALSNASNAYGETDRRTQNWQIQLNKAKAELNSMEKELSQNEKALNTVSKELNESKKQAGEFGEGISESGNQAKDAGAKFEGLGSVLKGVAAAMTAVTVAIGAAAVTAGKELVSLGNEYNKAVNTISASTGAAGPELEKLGETAQRVYTHNFGDSLDDVAQGLSAVRKTTGLMGQELEKAAESGFALRDTFGYDMQESARTANALMKNFGLDAKEAYNIIAVGAQNGADQNGDLLDTLNEYSAQYAALGLSADEFLTSLIKGAEVGVFSIDKVGDAVKEFNIRAKDGSDSTISAFDQLGLNAADTMARFAAGGEDAKAAFFEVISAIDGLEDPMIKNTTAVALFGTMYEDLEANVLPVLSGMKDETVGVYDALTQINEVKYNDLDSAFEGTKRSIQGVFLPAIGEVSASITDIFSTLSTEINKSNGDFDAISAAIGEAAGGITEVITQQLPMFIQLGADIVGSIGQAALDNLPALTDSAVSIVQTLLNGLISALPQLTQGALQLVTSLAQGIIQNLPSLMEAAVTMVVTLAEGIGSALPELIPMAVEAIITVAQGLIDNLDQVLDAAFVIIEGLADGLLNALPTLVEKLPEIITAIIDFIVESLPKIIEKGVEIVLKLTEGIIKAIPDLVKALPKIITAIVEGIMKLSSKMLDVGKNIVEGLWEGIKAKVEWLKEKVSGFLGGIVDSVKGVLGIQSPSKVFAGIGKYMGEGIGVGFEDAMADVEKDMQKAIPTDFDIDFPPIDVDFPSPKPGFGGGGTSRITLSPKVVIEKFVNNTAQDIDILAEKVGSKIASDINRRLAY